MNEKNLVCKVCGGGEFELIEGFYYCTECCTRHDDHQEVVFESEFNAQEDKKHSKVHKVNTTTNKVQISSWECYNYILRGLVDDLISVGAKKELEEMTLQVWAAYLRSLEVAFFSENSQELPKLNARYLKHDAEIIYNARSKVKRRKRRRDSVSIADTQQSTSTNRDWRNKKSKLDETLYKSSSMGTTSQNPSINHSITAINLCFNARSSKYMKGITKATSGGGGGDGGGDGDGDDDGDDQRQPRVKDMQRADHMISAMNIKQLYSILAIALNLIQDDIQLCDLTNFIQDGHIGSYNILKYFPDHLALNAMDILKKIDFYSYPLKYSEKCLRHHASLLCKNIGIETLRCPRISKLVQRYTMELCLPSMVANYVDRLLCVLPPQFATRARGTYPAYEARAMAYIIFVLKLMFGLDDKTEYTISRSAQKLNKKIESINRRQKSDEPPLFVWSKWTEYIEMRKIIIDVFHPLSREQTNTSSDENTDLFVQSVEKAIHESMEKLPPEQEVGGQVFHHRVTCMQSIFKEMLRTFDADSMKSIPKLTFEASLKPATGNLATIMEFLDGPGADSLKHLPVEIPDYMRVDHTTLNMRPFIHVQQLKEFFQRHNYHLKVTEIPICNESKYLGIFCTPALRNRYNVEEGNNLDDGGTSGGGVIEPSLQFTTNFASYSPGYYKQIVQSKTNRKLSKAKTFSEVAEHSMSSAMMLKTLTRKPMSEASTKDKEESPPKEDTCESSQNTTSNGKELELCVSCMDCWSLLGTMMYLTVPQKEELPTKLPRTFNWLINICAQMLRIDWFIIYEQLLVIEVMFGLGVEDLSNFKDCVYMKYNNPIKEINQLIKSYRDIW